jgi:hypothetical protein
VGKRGPYHASMEYTIQVISAVRNHPLFHDSQIIFIPEGNMQIAAHALWTAATNTGYQKILTVYEGAADRSKLGYWTSPDSIISMMFQYQLRVNNDMIMRCEQAIYLASPEMCTTDIPVKEIVTKVLRDQLLHVPTNVKDIRKKELYPDHRNDAAYVHMLPSHVIRDLLNKPQHYANYGLDTDMDRDILLDSSGESRIERRVLQLDSLRF